ncbi:hypothetical protein ABIA33_001428 [Streptacidiphilus sp. MAP12-16]|uniref:hypothetical protein n=1 Tax=Streptacidiphilus sp. MAP12-16 TaxID=3156300 RepID=UPI003513B9A3
MTRMTIAVYTLNPATQERQEVREAEVVDVTTPIAAELYRAAGDFPPCSCPDCRHRRRPR